MAKYFKVKPIHNEGECDLSINQKGILYTVGSDKLIYQNKLTTNEENKVKFDHPCVAISSTLYKGQYYIVVASGQKLFLISNLKEGKFKVLFEIEVEITQVVFSKSGKFIGLSTTCGEAWLYNMASTHLIKCTPGHSMNVKHVFFSNNENYLCSTAKDGCLRIYYMGSHYYQYPQLKHEYKFFKNVSSKGIEGAYQPMFNPEDTMIAVPGKLFIQIIELNNQSFEQSNKTTLTHDKEIFICHWINSEFLVTGAYDMTVKIWNMKKETLVLKIPEFYFTRMANYQNTFYGINHLGSLYKFDGLELLAGSQKKTEKIVDNLAREESQRSQENQFFSRNQPLNANNKHELDSIDEESVANSDYIDEQDIQKFIVEDDEASKIESIQSSQAPVKKKSIVDRIITCGLHQPIQHGTDFFSNARFLFYNAIGCIIQKVDGTTNIIEIEYHDKSLAHKRKTLFTGKQMKHFDLAIDKIAYANDYEVGFFGQKFWNYELVEEDKEDGIVIRAVCLGNDWLAMATDFNIQIFDLAGNHINTFAVAGNFVALACYEDIMVFLYVDAAPVYGCQSMRMNIWNINGNFETKQNLNITVRPNLLLKVFRFSEEGLLYYQDTKGNIRVYSIYDERAMEILPEIQQADPSQSERYWIFGMANYEILGFKLPEGQYQPPVYPRPIPHAIPMTMKNFTFQMDQPSKGYDNTLALIQWNRFILDHQRYRYNLWYRYKFARTEANPNFYRSDTILDEEELLQGEKDHDERCSVYVQTMIKNKEQTRALGSAKSLVRGEIQLNILIDLFRQNNMPNAAVKLEDYYNEIARRHQFDLFYHLRIKKLWDVISQNKSLVEKQQNRKVSQNMSLIPRNKSSSKIQVQSIKQIVSKLQEQSSHKRQKNELHDIHQSSMSQVTPSQSQVQIEFPTQTQTQTDNFSQPLEMKNPFLRSCSAVETLEKMEDNIAVKKRDSGTKNEEKQKRGSGNNK